MANRQTSDRVSSIAGKIMAKNDPFDDNETLADLIEKIVADPAGQGARDAIHAHFDDWIKDARTLAASALAQDETKGKRSKPSAGTSAYEMLAAAEQRNVEVTETLIHMVAATVLMKRLEHQMPVVSSMEVSFSPADMDEMHQRFDMSATRDGLITTVRIAERKAMPLPPGEAHLEDRPESLMRQDEPETPFAEQVEQHVHDRPIWAVRYYDKNSNVYLAKMHDKRDAEARRNDYITFGQADPSIENRFCLHPDCPAERCNHAEVTSGS